MGCSRTGRRTGTDACEGRIGQRPTKGKRNQNNQFETILTNKMDQWPWITALGGIKWTHFARKIGENNTNWLLNSNTKTIHK
jgi:hypothetical protein